MSPNTSGRASGGKACRRATGPLWASLAAAAAATACAAQPGVHRERASWEEVAGPLDALETFEAYASDVPFRAQPLALRAGITLRQVGNTMLHEFRNFIDAPEFGFPDHNGTPHLSCWIDYPEPGQSGIRLELTFDRPLAAWGADFWGAASGERLDVVPVDHRGEELGVLQAVSRSSAEREFLGFVAPPGERIERIILRSRRRFLGTAGEGFGLDDIALRYAGGGEPCPADCDPSTGPGVLDIFDFLCFQNRYATSDPYACGCDTATGPGVCDIFDFLCFQNAFAAGCP